MIKVANPSLQGIREKFILDDDDLLALAELSKPRLLTLADMRTPQELANEFWSILGQKHGFDYKTVVPDPTTKDKGTILAVRLTALDTLPEEPSGWTDRKCPACAGTGMQNEFSPCNKCGGTGQEYINPSEENLKT